MKIINLQYILLAEPHLQLTKDTKICNSFRKLTRYGPILNFFPGKYYQRFVHIKFAFLVSASQLRDRTLCSYAVGYLILMRVSVQR